MTNQEQYEIIWDKANKYDKLVKVLDEIKDEIIELRSKQNVGVMECLDIIDKYRESEDKG